MSDHQQVQQEHDPPERRPFAAFLMEQRRGALAVQLGDKLAEVCLAVADTNKKGQLTVTFDITPNGQGSVKVADKVAAKVPSADAPEAFFYVDVHGNLSRNDPRQPTLPGTVDEISERRAAGADA